MILVKDRVCPLKNSETVSDLQLAAENRTWASWQTMYVDAAGRCVLDLEKKTLPVIGNVPSPRRSGAAASFHSDARNGACAGHIRLR